MSGKYLKKRTKKKPSPWIFIFACVAVCIAVLLIVFRPGADKDVQNPVQEPVQNPVQEPVPEKETQPSEPETPEPENDIAEEKNILDLGSGVQITGMISYTGAFMEDRTDEVVDDVLAILVTNSGEEYIQTMNITMTAGETEAQFSLSTLFPGETVVVLEQNRMAYSTAPEFEQVQTNSVALFDAHPGKCEDQLEIQCLDGILNITNISGQDITEDILVYYKNFVGDMFYGGITYRLRVEGGLKAGEIKQGTAAHFNPDNSTIVFVTCG